MRGCVQWEDTAGREKERDESVMHAINKQEMSGNRAVKEGVDRASMTTTRRRRQLGANNQ